MSIKTGDKVRVEFKNEDQALEGRVTYVYSDGDFDAVGHLIDAGTNPEAYNITVLEKKQVEVGDIVKGKDLFDVLKSGTVVRNNDSISGRVSFLTVDERISSSGYVFRNLERWANVDFTVLFVPPTKEV